MKLSDGCWMKMVLALCVPTADAEEARLKLRQDDLLSRIYIPENKDGFIYLPLNRDIGEGLGDWKVHHQD